MFSSRRMRAGHVRPHRGERRQARRPLELLPHCLGCRPLGLLSFQHVSEDGYPVPAQLWIIAGGGIPDVRRWPGFW